MSCCAKVNESQLVAVLKCSVDMLLMTMRVRGMLESEVESCKRVLLMCTLSVTFGKVRFVLCATAQNHIVKPGKKEPPRSR